MKSFLVVFIICILSFEPISAQTVQYQKAEEKSENKPYQIDARHFLAKKDVLITNFLKENPNYFQEIKLKKKTAWNFSVGSTKSWFAEDLTKNDGTYSVPSTCRAVGTNCYIFVENSIWNTRVTQANVNAVMEAFDNSTPANSQKGIYETVTEVFGDAPDVDGDPKIIILILDIVDGYEAGTNSGYTAGYFYGLNQFATSGSNIAEIYYVDADPLDLSTANGLNTALNTTAHEFQHMVHFNYHDGSSGKPFQTTFINEGCSEVSSVVCGYPLRDQGLFNNEYNHYLLDWRSGDAVLNDYARAARYIIYLYDQFGPRILGNIVQSINIDIPSINDALNKLKPATSLRFPETLENWMVANAINSTSVDPAWGYLTAGTNTVNPRKVSNPNYSSGVTRVERAAADYIEFEGGKNLKVNFDDFGTGKLIFKAIKKTSTNQIDVEDMVANTEYTFSDFGSVYESITFAIMNVDAFNTYNYSVTSSGEFDAGNIVLAYDENPPTGVLGLANRDTVCVYFDGVPGGKLDSIRVALRQAGSVSGGIYEFTGELRPSPLGKVLMSNLTVTSNIAERPVYDQQSQSYPVPFPNWITVDLKSANIDVSKPFVVAFMVEGTYPDKNRIMITEQPYIDNHSFTFFTPTGSETPNWYNITASETTAYAYLIRSYVGVTATDIEVELAGTLPDEFTVSQNYPNPFNPSTKIEFALPVQDNVKLNIYNGMGELVQTVINDEFSAGIHSVNFDGSDFASGIYFYQIVVGNRIETKKMILMK
ncbi:MAG: T9SS type A sorting domain-containing protein [Melioribacteraceae bacterium]|nr:T9SS type A sorting domain-containing protein [Melioribacteraceae bacterium]MCF8264767.1 T9SS type A sorting domain-containing protein [Melioribacteraceae bacterium]